MATKLSDQLCFAWAGDFESLKQFIGENLKLEGSWTQPGGDKKVFDFDGSTIIWRKNKNLLYLEGEKASEVMKELCKQICKQDEDISITQQSSMQEVCNDLESLKLGQLVNTEAIQAMSGSISSIIPVIRQFQEFMDKTKKIPDDELRSEPTNTASESFAYANQENIDNGNNTKVNCPSVSDEFINSISDSNSISLNAISNENAPTCPTSANNSIVTYAEVVKAHASPSGNDPKALDVSLMIKNNQVKGDKLPGDLPNDGLIGVERKRKRNKSFFLSGINENVKEEQICSYLVERDVTPSKIFVFQSKRKGTVSAKIVVPSNCSSIVQGDEFWPKFIRCKAWRHKEREQQRSDTSTLKRNYSTFV